MVDIYQSFRELASGQREAIDFRIDFRKKDSRFAIIAPHGGKIERGTSRIADAIAGDDYAYYCFEGLKPKSHTLHISSNRFDEPHALSIVNRVDIVITIHGAYGKAPYVYLGGLHEELKYALILKLNEGGFAADNDPSPTRQGKRFSNICNRGRCRKGVQIEMTQGLRKSLFDQSDHDKSIWKQNGNFDHFVNTIRSVLQIYDK